jgi:cytochrome c551/c552
MKVVPSCLPITIHFGNGDVANYAEDGTLLMSNHWKNDALDGRSYGNYRNGKLAFEKFYAGGFKTGRWTFYLEDGNVNYTETFEEGKTRWDRNDDYSTVKYYLEGKPAYTATFVAGRKDKVTVHDEGLYKQLLVLQAPTGQKLFRQYCNSCHLPETDLVGPMMKGVAQKRSDEWLIKMIRNGDALLQSGDKKADALYKKWNNRPHPNFEKLTDEEIQLLLDYLKSLK